MANRRCPRSSQVKSNLHKTIQIVKSADLAIFNHPMRREPEDQEPDNLTSVMIHPDPLSHSFLVPVVFSRILRDSLALSLSVVHVQSSLPGKRLLSALSLPLYLRPFS